MIVVKYVLMIEVRVLKLLTSFNIFQILLHVANCTKNGILRAITFLVVAPACRGSFPPAGGVFELLQGPATVYSGGRRPWATGSQQSDF